MLWIVGILSFYIFHPPQSPSHGWSSVPFKLNLHWSREQSLPVWKWRMEDKQEGVRRCLSWCRCHLLSWWWVFLNPDKERNSSVLIKTQELWIKMLVLILCNVKILFLINLFHSKTGWRQRKSQPADWHCTCVAWRQGEVMEVIVWQDLQWQWSYFYMQWSWLPLLCNHEGRPIGEWLWGHRPTVLW